MSSSNPRILVVPIYELIGSETLTEVGQKMQRTCIYPHIWVKKLLTIVDDYMFLNVELLKNSSENYEPISRLYNEPECTYVDKVRRIPEKRKKSNKY